MAFSQKHFKKIEVATVQLDNKGVRLSLPFTCETVFEISDEWLFVAYFFRLTIS